ncbi:MAG: M28 family peptidase [Pirellulales bacterium]|nr:M28 family peptidase [Pirellulales bacterium]
MSTVRRNNSNRLRSCSGILILILLASAGAVPAAEKASGYQAAVESITGDDLLREVKVLAGEKMEGRGSGSRGGRLAAKYLAKQFAKRDLLPGGPDGKFGQPFLNRYQNVLGTLPGRDPELKKQYVLVGAHYDHLGHGGGGAPRGPQGVIYPGADDNASGTSALLELAEALGFLAEPPRRTIIFAAWDAEERGLYGSKHWAAHPTVPVKNVAAAFNLDMIGMLRDDRVTVIGLRSGTGWRRLLTEQNAAAGFQFEFRWRLLPQADHFPLFEKGIPVLMLHTGMHDEYHRPSDKPETLNGPGMSRVVRLVFGMMYELAERPSRMAFRQAARYETAQQVKQRLRTAPPPPRLGVTLDPQPPAAPGVGLLKVAPQSAADKAGLKQGDRILRFAGKEISNYKELTGAVATAESPAAAEVKNPDEDRPHEVRIELPGKPLRLGILWAVDDAEPGTLILSHVIPGSPADRAGLQPGDRVYQIAGRDFTDDNEFLRLAQILPDPLELLIERAGKLQVVVLHLQPVVPVKRAA